MPKGTPVVTGVYSSGDKSNLGNVERGKIKEETIHSVLPSEALL